MNKFEEAYLKIINQQDDGQDWYYDDPKYDYEYDDPGDDYDDEVEYIRRAIRANSSRDPQDHVDDPLDCYNQRAWSEIDDYIKNHQKELIQYIRSQISNCQDWDTNYTNEQKLRFVVLSIYEKVDCEPSGPLLDAYDISEEEAIGLEDEVVVNNWKEDLKTFANGEFDFFKQNKEQTNQQIEECGDGCTAPPPPCDGPAGAPPPPPAPPAGANPLQPIPPPHPPRAGIHTRNVGALYVPTAPFGWWSRFKNTSTKKKRKKVRRRKKK